MKNHFKQLLLIVPLVLIAGGAFATYSFVGPTAAPSGNNTDAPLDIGSTDQIKNGGLAVNTFQSRTGSDFGQQTAFTGLVNGGTPNVTNSTIQFGTATNVASVNDIGTTTIAGNYQSNTLKTGGGLKPLCADANGVFYICGATVVTPPTNTPIYIYPIVEDVQGTPSVGATISEPITTTVNVTISAYAGSGGTVNPLSYLKNAFTAEAVSQGVCHYTSTPTVVGTVTINPDNATSWNTVPLQSGCTASNTILTISSYNPMQTAGGRAIKASQ